MKKVLSILLVLAMSVSMLTGCGSDSGKEGKEASGDGGASAEGQSTEASGDEYEMVMEVINFGYDDPDLQKVQDAVNEITVPEIGVRVKFMTVPIQEMSTKLGLLVAGGEKIDLVCAGLLTTPANLVSDGLLLPITEYVEKSEVLSSLSEGIIDACKVDGEIYAFPGMNTPGTRTMFFYDADLAKQYNIQVPDRISTKEDWDSIFEQVKNSGMEQYGISLGDGVAAEPQSGYDFDTLGERSYCSYGVVMDMVNGTTVENWYATEEYAEKCRLHREWYEKGFCVPDSISNGYTTSDSMTQGAIFGFVSSGGVGMSDAYFASVTGKNIASVPMGDITIKSEGVVNFCWGVPSACENPEKVMQFLELAYSNTDLANLLTLGIEGEHYVKRENSQIVDYPEGVDAQSVGYGSFITNFGDSREILYRGPLTDEFVAAIPDYGIGKAKASKFLGYSFNPANVSTELTAVTAVIGQYAPALECGTVDPETTIPEFLEALEAAGMSKIIAENQAQLDAWLAEQ